MNAYQLQQYFNACKDSIEREYQKELDKLAGEDEEKLESIACAFDPDDYKDNLEDR